MITLSEDQKKIHDAVADWFKTKKKTPHVRIGGYAGTGKTTLTSEIARTLKRRHKKLRIAFCAFTGKAAYVIREKLTAAQSIEDEYVGTIHSLMYHPVEKNGVIVRWDRVPAIEADLIVVDEASMVSEPIWNDLLSYKIPLLAVGDHGQLPPVGGTFNLMENPDHALTRIHRQAEGNPIIKVSQMAREEGRIPLGHWDGLDGQFARKIELDIRSTVSGVQDIENTLFLCGRNRTRQTVNETVRSRRGFVGAQPLPGERVICLKNNKEVGLFNGMGGILLKIDHAGPEHYDVQIAMNDETAYKGYIIRSQFGCESTLREHPKLDPRELKDLFDWGYALTVWKAQGSEAENVVLFEERFSQMSDDDYRRYLYTGVTRARKRLLIVGQR